MHANRKPSFWLNCLIVREIILLKARRRRRKVAIKVAKKYHQVELIEPVIIAKEQTKAQTEVVAATTTAPAEDVETDQKLRTIEISTNSTMLRKTTLNSQRQK